MEKKNECYLCGGTLHDGYCPDCGLDNTKIQRKNYHLNGSFAVGSVEGDSGKASVKGKSVVAAVAAAGFAAAVIGLIWELALNPDITDHEEFEAETEAKVVAEVPYDLYAQVEKELEETGEHYEAELEQGDYLVGVHLPEGAYTAELLYGTGGLSVDDYENGIYLWQSFGTEGEYDEVGVMEDIRLYAGAHLQIRNAVGIRMTTENGQAAEMEGIENPLTEVITLKKNQTMVVGEDISPGVYDLSVTFNWAVLRCRIPDDSYEEGYYENSYWISGEDGADIYRNVYLKEGIVITAEENTLELTPSPVIGSGDYEEYYRYY